MGRRPRGSKRFVNRSPDPSVGGITIIRGTSTRPIISYKANVNSTHVTEPLSQLTPIRFDTEKIDSFSKQDDDQSQVSDHDEKSSMEDDRLYCVCQRLYDGRTMIACDRCDNWYHNDCVGIPEDSVKLVDIFICPNCQSGTDKQTTWKKKCARPECNLASRKLSKYCSDGCGIKLAATRLDNISTNPNRFWSAVRAAQKPEGIVNIEYQKSINDSNSKSNDNTNPPTDLFLKNLRIRLKELEGKKLITKTQIQLTMSRSKYLNYAISRWENMCLETARALQIQQSSSSAPDPSTIPTSIPTKPKRGSTRGRGRGGRGGVRKSEPSLLSAVTSSSEAPCGFDLRLIWDDKDWTQWTSSEQFSALFENKDKYNQQQKQQTSENNERVATEEVGNSPSRSETTNIDHGIEEGMICLIMKKKCDRHLGWQKTRENDFQTEINTLNMLLDKLKSEIVPLKQEIEDRLQLFNFRMNKKSSIS